ncbi:MAG: peptidylprolyl isomerase [gamma proteobacterium symbiont of Bathyaustriella thionipta]|nr:peptidylprolyl isomerase [gamma proteobacterium symbiont of Bathyaustriella thionipta]
MSRNDTPTRIQPGSRVSLHLALRFANGDTALSTFEEEPLQFRLGDGTLSAGLEMALYGLSAGDREKLELMPEQAFGAHDASLVHSLLRSDFPADMPLESGLVIQFDTPSGEQTAGTIKKIETEQVEVDFNHPLAGVPLHLETYIVSIEPAPDKESA